MLLEMDQVAVKSVLWNRVKSGDADALAQLRSEIDGLHIYLHAFPVAEDEVVVTLRELEGVNALDEVILNQWKPRNA